VLPSWYPTEDFPLNGIFFKEQAVALRRAGVDVTIAYPELTSPRRMWVRGNFRDAKGEVRVESEDGVPTLRCKGIGVSREPLVGISWVAWALHLVRHQIASNGRPDLLHVHSVAWPNAAGVAALAVERLYGIPYVVTEHSSAFLEGTIRRSARYPVAAALNGASAVVAVSSTLARSVERYCDRPVEVIPNLVDADFFVPPPRPRAGRRVFRFLTIAWFHPLKGLDVLLKAFAAAFRDDPGVVIEIGGDGAIRASLARLCADLGLSSRVWFLGRLDRMQAREAMWRADAFVLPSLVETFGIVLVEAMATGLPVVATLCGGPQETVAPEAGLLVDKGDVEALAAALVRMRERCGSFDANAIRDRVCASYDERPVVRRIRDLYRRAAR
jgi:glycosyltransferase involved in cell wall biosynthesis